MRQAGVALLVCGARLGAVMASLCAQEGVAVVEGVDSERLRAICAACGVAPLRRWPPASALPQVRVRAKVRVKVRVRGRVRGRVSPNPP